MTGGRHHKISYIIKSSPLSVLSILTKHDGGVSLIRIERALPFAVLSFILESQLAICVRLHRQTSLS